MTVYNTVAVTVTVDAAAGEQAEGNALAVPSGAMWPDDNNNPFVQQVVNATLIDSTCTLTLTASDNFDAGVLKWDFLINVRGIPTINVPGCVVNHSDGGTQSVWDILAAAGWTPITQP